MMLMEVHDTGAIKQEEPRRPRRLYTADWKFRIGQAVRLGELSAIVLSRDRSACGRELYRIWVAGEASGRPIRLAAGVALTA